MCNNSKNGTNYKNGLKADISRELVMIIEDLPIKDLYTMREQHKLHIKFLKDNNILSDDKKTDIIQKIEYIFSIIEDRSGEIKIKYDSNNDLITPHKVSN